MLYLGLRISIERGGCAGQKYVMFLDCQREGDVVFKCKGACVFGVQESIPYLGGSILDYKDSLNGSGFHIQNLQAIRNCGCGTSFEVNL